MDEFNSKRKKTVLTALAFLAVFTVILFFTEWFLFRNDICEDGLFKAESIREILLNYRSDSKRMTDWFFEKINENVRLEVFILQEQVQDGAYTGRKIFDDGMVVRVKDGKAELPPEGAALLPDLKPEDITAEYTPKLVMAADGRDVLITSGRILDGLYYLDWTELDEYHEFFSSQLDGQQLLNYIAEAYGGEIFLVSDSAPRGAVLMGTDDTEALGAVGEIALREKDSGEAYFALNTDQDRHMCYILPLEGEEQTAIYCDIITDEVETGTHRAFTKVLFSGCFLAGMLVLCFSVLSGIRDGSISEKKAAGYTPEKLKKKILIFSLVSGLALMFITVFTTFVQESHHENRKGSSILDSLELQIAGSDYRSEMARQTDIDWYQYYAEKIGAQITDFPGILQKETLSGIARIIDADLIMAFDEKGNQTACSAAYSGFSLDDDGPDKGLSDLHRLLKGIPVIIRGPETDFVTGEVHYIIGVPYRTAGSEGNGALLFFAAPASLAGADESADISRIYSNLVTGEELIMEIDPETFEILSASDPRAIKSKALDLDVNDPNLQENGLDIFALDDVLYYGISRTIRDRIWYYAEKASGIVLSALIYSAVTGLIFAGICLLTGRYAVSGYTPEVYEACLAANREQTSGPAAGIPANTGQTDKLSGKELLRRRWQQLSPEGKTLTFLRVAVGLAMLILLAAGFLSGNAALAFYITGRWQRGINPFSITAIVVIICLGRLLLFVMDLIFTLISTEIPEKARTIFQLIRSLLRSVILIGLFYNCLSYLGVNTGALLASVGVFSLALSLGAKDLVADILAGLGIVMEEQFQTGDVVEIGGFKGFVEEIGIRTTKIRTLGTNNIKIVNNSQINNVINYSRELSLFRVNIDLPVFLPLDMVTEYLKRELPGIREEIPTIISGPEFAGITAIDREHMTIMIAGQCQEKDEGLINRAMNLKIKERIDRLIDIQYK